MFHKPNLALNTLTFEKRLVFYLPSAAEFDVLDSQVFDFGFGIVESIRVGQIDDEAQSRLFVADSKKIEKNKCVDSQK